MRSRLTILKGFSVFLVFFFLMFSHVKADVYWYFGTDSSNYQFWFTHDLGTNNRYLHQEPTGVDGIYHLFLEHPGEKIQEAFCVEQGVHTTEYYTHGTTSYYGGPACVMKKYNINTSIQTATFSNMAKLSDHATYAKAQKEIWALFPNGKITNDFLITDVTKVAESCKTYSASCSNTAGTITLNVSSDKLQLDEDYYVTSPITVAKTGGASSYTVTLTGAPSGSGVYDASTNQKITGNTTASKVYVKIPVGSEIKEVTLKVASSWSVACTTTVPTFKMVTATDYQKTVTFGDNVTISTPKSGSATASKTFTLDTGGFSIKKVDSITKSPLSGAVFQLLDADKNPAKYADGTAVETKTTDREGTITFLNLNFGTYYLQEIKSPPNYQLSSTLITVTVGSTPEVVSVPNIPLGKIVLNKTDSVSKQPLSGVTFQLLDENKNPAKDADGNLLAAKTTDSNGNITFEHLKFGIYYLQETSSLENYVALTTAIEVNVNAPVITKDLENVPFGKIVLTKVDEETGDVLKGARFQLLDKNLKPATDVYGNPVIEKETDTSGKITFEHLSYGTYYLKETVNPEGYKVIANPTKVTVSKASIGITVKNTPIEVVVVKKDLQDHTKILSGATIVIKNVTTNEVFNEFITEDHEIKLRFVPGKYILQEVISPDGYLIYDENIQIDVSKTGDVVISSKDNHYYQVEDGKVVIYNEPIKIFISKKDITNDKELAGATIVIYDEEKNKILEFVSTQDPYEFYIKPGKYTLEETVAPQGYDKIKNSLEFEIDKNGNILIRSKESKYYLAESNRVIIYNGIEDVFVPNTGTFLSIGTIIIGVGMLGVGIYMIIRQKKSMQM